MPHEGRGIVPCVVGAMTEEHARFVETPGAVLDERRDARIGELRLADGAALRLQRERPLSRPVIEGLFVRSGLRLQPERPLSRPAIEGLFTQATLTSQGQLTPAFPMGYFTHVEINVVMGGARPAG